MTINNAVSCGNFHSAILKKNHLYTTGKNTDGQAGVGTKATVTTFTQIPGEYKKIACGSNFTFAIDTEGFLWATGSNKNGELGLGDGDSRDTFTKIGTKKWLDVACGQNQVIAIDIDKKLWSWGLNSYGQLGHNTTTPSNVPILIEKVLDGAVMVTGKEWSKVFCGYTSSYAIDTGGFLYGFGENSYNKIGTATTNNKIPNKIGSKTWVTGAGGYAHTMLIDTEGFLWGIGEGDSGQLGRGGTSHAYNLVQIGTKKWLDVACGFRHSLAIDTEGFLWTTGRSEEFQTANNSSTQIELFRKIGEKKWTCAAGGYYHTLIIDELNNFFGAGRTAESQLGILEVAKTPTAILNFISSLVFSYLFSKSNTAYTVENGTLKSLGTITTANASTLFKSGVEAITKEHCVLVGQQLGKAKIMRMLV